MKPLSCAFLLFALLVSAAPGLCSPRRRHHHPAPAQASAAATQPATPTLKVDPLELLRQFEAPANEQYRLGPGDVVTISIPGHPEIPAQQTIGPDGRITLPLAGDIELNNKTRPQAAAAIKAALTPYYTHLSVTVAVDQYTSNRVLVLGDVERPGIVQFAGQPTLLEAITRAGLPPAQPSGSQAMKLAPASPLSDIPERCAIYRGNNEVAWVQLRKLLSTGNTLADLRLRRGDVVFVPNGTNEYVSVLGEVQHPGAVQLSPDMTLASVLALAGGINKHAGLGSHIHVYDPHTGKTVEVPFKDLLHASGRAAEVELHAGDVIYIPSTKMSKMTTMINQFNPLTSLFTLIALSYHI